MSLVPTTRQPIPTLVTKGSDPEGDLRFEESPDTPQDLGVHGECNHAGLGILLAGMIRREKARQRRRQLMNRAVTEGIRSEILNVLLFLQHRQIRA